MLGLVLSHRNTHLSLHALYQRRSGRARYYYSCTVLSVSSWTGALPRCDTHYSTPKTSPGAVVRPRVP